MNAFGRPNSSRFIVFVGVFLIADAVTNSISNGDQAHSRPNVIYIVTDQQHAGMMSCAGNRWLQTPAMDRLAASGMRFELAYSPNPVCCL